MKSLTEGKSAVVLAVKNCVDMVSSTIPNSNGVLTAKVLIVMASSKFVSSINERERRNCADRVSLIEAESEYVLTEEITLVMKSLTEGESAVVLAAES